MTNILLSLALAFAPLGNALPPDRCAELGTDGYPRACDPIGEHIAPIWDDLVCCDASACTAVGPFGCAAGTSVFFCEFAEIDAANEVTCLFTVPHYCDVHDCPPAQPEYQQPPQAQELCCYDGGCYPPEGGICGGLLFWCDLGSTNDDGTVTCDDEDTP